MNGTIEYYNQNAEKFVSETLTADMGENRARFLKYIKPGGRILDAGCGSGRDALAFKNAGYRVDAFDASPEICRLASETIGVPVECKRFEELTGETEYDGIWACASLLHVNQADLPAVMLRLAGLLKPGGILYASFKEGEKERTKDGRYFHDMTEAASCELFCNAGLEVVDQYKSVDVRPGRENEGWVNTIGRAADRRFALKRVQVVAAVIADGDHIFATQRGYGAYKDWWEFPGGKIEADETPEAALSREIREELKAEIIVGELIDTVEYDYPEFHLSMRCYWAAIAHGEPVLVEHEAARWLTQDDLDTVNWLPADRLILDKIREVWRITGENHEVMQYMKRETIERILKFTADRDWDQFHTPANLAKAISIEANELLECFQWNDTDYDIGAVKDELADVIVYCVDMVEKLGLDVDEIINAKMTKNEAKYPVEKARGRATKYTEL